MKELEHCVRSIEADGLDWKACKTFYLLLYYNSHFFFCSLAKLVPIAYGIMKLQINCVVEDDKIGTEFLEEEITKFEDFVS